MKYLVKFNVKLALRLRYFFITEHLYTSIKDILNSEGGNDKYAIIDTGAKTISLFNKINEEKIKAVKLDIYNNGTIPTMQFMHFFYDFLLNEPHFILKIGHINKEVNNTIIVQAFDENGIHNHAYNTAWHVFSKESCPWEGDFCVPCLYPHQFENTDYLKGKCALTIMELNYSFCELGQKHSRDMFVDVTTYTSPMLREFLFAEPTIIAEHLKEHNVRDAILNELTVPAFNKSIQKLVNDINELTVVGIKPEQGKTIWIPLTIMLQYMDMTMDVFNSCLNNLKDKKVECSFSVPALEQFLDTTVTYMKIYNDKSTYFYNFANILDSKAECIDLRTGKPEVLPDYLNVF